MTIPIEEKLDRVLSEMAALRADVRSLIAVKAAKENTADEMAKAQRLRMERHQEPCQTCDGPGVIEGSDGAGACPACNSDGGTPIAAPTLVAVTAEPGEGRAAVRAVRDRLKPTNPKPPKTVTLVAELADGHTTTDTWETE